MRLAFSVRRARSSAGDGKGVEGGSEGCVRSQMVSMLVSTSRNGDKRGEKEAGRRAGGRFVTRSDEECERLTIATLEKQLELEY